MLEFEILAEEVDITCYLFGPSGIFLAMLMEQRH